MLAMQNTTRTLNREWPGLIAKIARGDQKAFSLLYEQSSPQIYGLILRMVNHTQIAEEVTMDVYVQVWKQAQSYNVNRGTAMGWLMTIARTRAIDHLRKLKRTSTTRIEEIAHVASDRASPEEQSSERQRADHVRKALASLPFEQREALILAYFDGYSQSEISVKLGLPLGTVKTRIRLGMMKLRDVLAPYEMDPYD